jgi:TM2 domain-containing membrane protein YozV
MTQKAIDEKFCGDCGTIIKIKAEICPACGVRQAPTPERKNKGIATLFCFFLGAFGAHKFYLGQIGQGICYFLLSWTFVPALIAFVEFVLLTLMSERAFNEKYG